MQIINKLRDCLRTSNPDGEVPEHIHQIDRLIITIWSMLSRDVRDMEPEAKRIRVEMLRQKVCGVSGIVAPVIGLATVFLSTRLTPGFSWRDHPLSYITNTDNHKYFMTGLGVSGMLSTLFAYGLYAKKDATPYEKACAVIFGICGMMLSTAVSIKEKDTNGKLRPQHYVPAIGYFALGPIALMSLGAEMIAQPSKRNAGLAASAAGALALIAILTRINPDIAVPETLEAAILGAWAAGTGLALMKEGPKIATNEVARETK